jgi:hypothetical protein
LLFTAGKPLRSDIKRVFVVSAAAAGLLAAHFGFGLSIWFAVGAALWACALYWGRETPRDRKWRELAEQGRGDLLKQMLVEEREDQQKGRSLKE